MAFSRILFGLVFGLAFSAQAKTVLFVSDIDDTVRRTHMNKWSAALINASTKFDNEFLGMRELYLRAVCRSHPSPEACLIDSGRIGGRDRATLYVTASPGKLAQLGVRFLDTLLYPKDGVFARESLGDPKLDFKAEVFEAIVTKSSYDEYAFLGDNGQDDPGAFDELANNPGTAGKSIFYFMHGVYGLKPEALTRYKYQVLYLTAADLALHYFARGWISEADLLAIHRVVASGLADKDTRSDVIPKWTSCTWFAGREVPQVKIADPLTSAMVVQVENEVRRICKSQRQKKKH